MLCLNIYLYLRFIIFNIIIADYLYFFILNVISHIISFELTGLRFYSKKLSRSESCFVSLYRALWAACIGAFIALVFWFNSSFCIIGFLALC